CAARIGLHRAGEPGSDRRQGLRRAGVRGDRGREPRPHAGVSAGVRSAMSMTLGLGILGMAHGHVGTYCAQWATMTSDVRLAAVWDHDTARAASASERFGFAIESSVEALLARSDVDAVVIGAETSLHA